MTVVLAIRCNDGVVIAADTQVTDSDRGMSYPARKLHPLGDSAAWGGSGARSVLLELEGIFASSAAAICESDDIARELQERVLPVLKHHYENFIAEIPGEQTTGTPSAYVLAAGMSDNGPWIIEVNPHGMVSHYEEVGFHAIGSGAPLAHQAGSLLAHFKMLERDVDYGVVAARRVILALSQTSPSVGGEMDICRITADEPARHLNEDEMAEVAEQVTRWSELEQEALDKLFT